MGGNAFTNLVDLFLVNTGFAQTFFPDGALQSGSETGQQLLGRCHAQNDGGLAVVLTTKIGAAAYVLQNLFGHDQRQQLGGIGSW